MRLYSGYTKPDHLSIIARHGAELNLPIMVLAQIAGEKAPGIRKIKSGVSQKWNDR
jgi:hypothetical protein